MSEQVQEEQGPQKKNWITLRTQTCQRGWKKIYRPWIVLQWNPGSERGHTKNKEVKNVYQREVTTLTRWCWRAHHSASLESYATKLVFHPHRKKEIKRRKEDLEKSPGTSYLEKFSSRLLQCHTETFKKIVIQWYAHQPTFSTHCCTMVSQRCAFAVPLQAVEGEVRDRWNRICLRTSPCACARNILNMDMWKIGRDDGCESFAHKRIVIGTLYCVDIDLPMMCGDGSIDNQSTMDREAGVRPGVRSDFFFGVLPPHS